MMTIRIMFPQTNCEGFGQLLMILMNFCNSQLDQDFQPGQSCHSPDPQQFEPLPPS